MRKKYRFLGTFLVSTLLASVANAGDPLFCENEVGSCEYKYDDGSAASCTCENGDEDAVYGAPLPEDAAAGDINEYCLRALDTICDGENPVTETVETDCENDFVRCDAVAGFAYLYADCECTENGQAWTMDGFPTVGRLPDTAELKAICLSSADDAALECAENGDTDEQETDLGVEDSNADSNGGEAETDDTADDDSDTDKEEDTANGTGQPTDTGDKAEQAASESSSGCSTAPFHTEASWFTVLSALLS